MICDRCGMDESADVLHACVSAGENPKAEKKERTCDWCGKPITQNDDLCLDTEDGYRHFHAECARRRGGF